MVAFIFVCQVSRDPQSSSKGQEPGSAAQGQARRMRGERDTWSVVRKVLELLPYDGVELSHGDLFGTFNCLNNLLLMLLREERDDLSTDSAETLHDLCLFVHLDVEPVGHLIVHDVVPLHFGLLTGQFLAFQFETVVLCLKELEFFFNAVQSLQNSELK